MLSGEPSEGNVLFVDIGDDLECGLDTIVFNLSVLDGLNEGLAGEAKDVERVVASQSDQLAAVRPVNLPRRQHEIITKGSLGTLPVSVQPRCA